MRFPEDILNQTHGSLQNGYLTFLIMFIINNDNLPHPNEVRKSFAQLKRETEDSMVVTLGRTQPFIVEPGTSGFLSLE